MTPLPPPPKARAGTPDTETTGVIPRPGLVDTMRADPGFLLRIVTEWVATCLVVAAGLALVFLLVLGCFALTRQVP